MNSAALNRRHPRRNQQIGDRLESLEARCLLTVKFGSQITIQEQANPNQPGTTELLIVGTKGNDNVSISDNGTGTAGNMFVSLSGGRDFMSTGAVTAIDVITGKGSDHVTYELDSNLQATNQELVLVGSGLKSGGGALQFTVNIVGAILDGSNLLAIAVPDPKKLTTMMINDSGEIDGTLSTGISTFGDTHLKPGPENYQFQSTGTIGPDGNIETGMIGGSHNDVAALSYSGTNNGEISLVELGNGGKDQLSADIFMIAGSTGLVGESSNPSLVKGKGKDHLRFTIERGTDTTSTTGIFAQAVGTTKKDVILHTANVTAKSKGTVILMS